MFYHERISSWTQKIFGRSRNKAIQGMQEKKLRKERSQGNLTLYERIFDGDRETSQF